MIFTPKTLSQAQGKAMPINWAARLIKTHRHWWRTEGVGVKVAILDSGINQEHPAFEGAIVEDGVWDFTVPDEESGGFWTPKKVKRLHGAEKDLKERLCRNVIDDSGHGTHCAGIIAARSTTKDGMCGIAPQSKLYVAKVISGGKGNWESATAAIEWVLSENEKINAHNENEKRKWENLPSGNPKKAKPVYLEAKISIINMSFSGNLPTPQFYEVIHKALAAGICIITAAGNEGARLGNGIGFPGKYGSVITVGSHDEFGTPSNFSSRGGEIDFLAPGYDVWSTDVTGHNLSKKYHDFYQKRSGTSMAAPFVSGLAALIKSKHLSNANSQTPAENCQDLYKHLIRMSAHPGYFDQESGYGPLLSFGNWDKIVNSQAVVPKTGFSESFIYYRENEPLSTQDDRVDIHRLQDDEYWRGLIKSGSGGPWSYQDIPFLKSHISKQARQVGFLISKEELKDNDIRIHKNDHEWVFETTSLDRYVEKDCRVPLAKSERFFEQPILKGRTVFHASGGEYFFTSHHDLKVLKKNGAPEKAFKKAYKYDLRGYYIIFDYKISAENQFNVPGKSEYSRKITIKKENIFKCHAAAGPKNINAKEEDWLVIKALPISKSGKRAEVLMAEKTEIVQERKQIFLSKKPRICTVFNRAVYSIGFGYGLPQKFIPDGTQFREGSTNLRECSLDMFKGNSGSPVFSCDTFEIIGIHAKGENRDVFVARKKNGRPEMIWNSCYEESIELQKSTYQIIDRVKVALNLFRQTLT